MLSVLKLAQVLLCVTGISTGQMLLRMGALNLTNAQAPGFWLMGLRINAWLVGGVALLGCASLLWIWVLRDTALSLVYPFAGLCFILVPALCFFILGEPLNFRHLAGGLLICAGVIVTFSGSVPR